MSRHWRTVLTALAAGLALAGGDAVVYILPDTKPIEQVFPAFAAQVEPARQQPSGSSPTSPILS